ncbi:alpha/beta hydrolase [Breznakia sp. OttesenSCG-928-G09]|nr:alpha/beta hydrolase [Breznakia sp. OttesenSCG-928-G09]
MSYFVRNLVELNYEVIGEGIPFIFLHGLGGDIEQPKNVYKPIEGVKLIVLDQRGHGKSEITDWKTLDFDTLADDVIGLAKYLKLEQFYLAGISMGAGVSTNIAIRYPEFVKGLVLIRIAWLDQPMEKQIKTWFENMEKYLHMENGKELFIQDDMYKRLIEETPQVAASLLRFFDDPNAIKNPNKFKIMPSKQPINKLADLEKIKAPTMILSNQQDPIHPFQYGDIYKKYIKDVNEYEITSKAVDENKHLEELNSYLRQFIQG